MSVLSYDYEGNRISTLPPFGSMPPTIPAIWRDLALLALAAVALAPFCEYLNRRYVAADPWKAT
ncbi:MAG: hypothetical protein E2591_00570 [Achromobacter sp.]|uniref:hypothetical protein n=1 Tax=Achromobacter sp. TaxID=134375 RepID=UPI0012CF988A|nr:hypothetical protein [Achromobacter sp.]